MAQTEFRVNTSRTLDSTKLMKLPKAIENLYYAKLVTGTPVYAKSQALWINWHQMGFGTAIRQGPPDINRDDRCLVETEPAARWVQVRLESPKADLVKHVEAVVTKVETLRVALKGKDEADRLKALMADNDIAALVVNPVIAALKPLALRAEESDRIIRAAQEGVLWLTDDDFVGTSIGNWTASEGGANLGSTVEGRITSRVGGG